MKLAVEQWWSGNQFPSYLERTLPEYIIKFDDQVREEAGEGFDFFLGKWVKIT